MNKKQTPVLLYIVVAFLCFNFGLALGKWISWRFL
jgi:uncharacterized protein YneF (UPF0154 family)